MSLTLDLDCMRLMTVFESITKAKVRDCIKEDGRLIFVVEEGHMGAAKGKGGSNVQNAQRTLGRGIKLVEHSADVKRFTENLFENIKPKSIQVDVDEKTKKAIVYVTIGQKQKGLAIGRDGENLERIKLLLQRHHGIEDIVIR